MKDFSILVIDDEPAQILSIKSYLSRRQYNVLTANSGEEGLSYLNNGYIDLVLTDYRMPGISGLDVVRKIKHFNPELPVVVITAFSDTEDAVRVMKEGAFDYLSKPIDLDELDIIVKKVVDRKLLISENKLLREQLKTKYKFDSIISQSGELEEVLNTAVRVANSKAPVLIRGESGTGKELIARAIHFSSDRKDNPLVTVNCAALPDNLLESELFGHEKGSFTGAIGQRIGRFERANGELSLSMKLVTLHHKPRLNYLERYNLENLNALVVLKPKKLMFVY